MRKALGFAVIAVLAIGTTAVSSPAGAEDEPALGCWLAPSETKCKCSWLVDLCPTSMDCKGKSNDECVAA